MMGIVLFILSLTLYLWILSKALVTVVLGNRQPIRAIAWILALIFLPFLGLFFYYFLGQNRRKESYISRQYAGALVKKSIERYDHHALTSLPSHYTELIKLFDQQNRAMPFPDNEVKIVTEGNQMFLKLLRDIRCATEHIHLQVYIFAHDAVGRLLKDVLMDKARGGVEVRLIYDDVGCWDVPYRFFEEMREVGIEVRSFLPVKFPQFTSSINYRNHRKIVVIDGRVGYIGGMNFAYRYIYGNELGRWKDMHLRFEGGAVYGLQRIFLEDWYFIDRSLITASRYYPPLSSTFRDGAITQIVSSAPIGPWREIMQGLTLLIMRARKYVYIQTPYFLPAESILFAMQTAALAGVDVRLMLPQKSDSRLVNLASYSYLGDVLRAGVRVYLYTDGFLHAKMLVSDDEIATCGSTNIDFRSLEHNFEANAVIYDHEVAMRFKAIFHADMELSKQISLDEWEMLPKLQRFRNSLIRLLSPML